MPLIPLLGLATLGGVLGLAGGFIFLLNENLKNFLSKYSVPFASGVLLTVALLDLVPEAVENSGEISYLLILVSFFLVFSFEHLFFKVHHHDGDKKSITIGTTSLVIVGDTIHNFIDGVAIATAYLVDPTFGLVVAISAFLHEVPHEIGDFGILLNAGWKKSKIFLVNFLSAMATFVGALFVYLVASENTDLIGVLMSLSAGLFLYLGASDFLPGRHEHNESTSGKVLTVIIASVVMIFVGYLLPHSH